MAYAMVGGGLDTEHAIRLPIGEVAYKNGHPDFAGCPIAMRQTHGLCCGLRGLNAESAIRPSSQKGRNARARRGTLPG